MLTPPSVISRDVRTETRPRALSETLNGAFRYWRIASAILAGTILLAIIAALLIPPAYRAEARLLTLNAGVYDMQAENTNPAQALNPTDVANVEIQLLQSAELHRAVARRELGSGATPQAIAAQAEKLEAAFHVTKVTDANVIELTYVDRDPVAAARTLQALLDGYFAARAEVLTSGRAGFLTAQLASAQAQLDAIDRQIVTVERTNNVVDIAAQVTGAVQQTNDLAKARLDAQAALADGRRSVATLRRGASGVPRQVELYSDNAEAARSIGDMQTNLLQLRARRADIASRYMQGSPQVQQLDKQIAGMEASIARGRGNLVATRRVGRNDFYYTAQDRLVQAEAAAAGSEARSGVLGAQEQASRARLAQLIDVSNTLSKLRLQHDILSDSVRSIAGRVSQAKIQQNQAASTTGTNVRVIEAPVAPDRRSNPPLLFVVAGVFIGAALAGIALVVLAGARTTFLSAGETARALDLSVLPVASGTAGDRAYRELAATIAGEGTVGATVLLLAPSARVDLRDAALGLGGALRRRVPEGALLVRFAEEAGVPSHADMLAIQPLQGVATTVIGADAYRRHGVAAALLDQLRQRFRYVVVTAPPAPAAGDAEALVSASDAVFLVLRADETSRTAATGLAASVRDLGGHLDGALLLGVRSYLPRWVERRLGAGGR